MDDQNYPLTIATNPLLKDASSLNRRAGCVYCALPSVCVLFYSLTHSLLIARLAATQNTRFAERLSIYLVNCCAALSPHTSNENLFKHSSLGAYVFPSKRI